MTAKQLNKNVGRLLASFKKRVENASPEDIKRLRLELREERQLIFVNAKPYFREYRPRTLARTTYSVYDK